MQDSSFSHNPSALCERLIALAERDPRRGERIARRVYEQTTELAAQPWAAYALGWALMRWDRIDEAAPLLQAAATSFAAQGAHTTTLHIRMGLLVIAIIRMQSETLQQDCLSLIAELRLINDQRAIMRVQSYQAIHLVFIGSAKEALELLDTLRPSVEQFGATEDHAWLERAYGLAWSTTGAVDQAHPHFERAAALFQQCGQRAEYAKLLIERSNCEYLQEDFVRAIQTLQQASTHFAHLGMAYRELICQKNRGLIYGCLGLYDEALRLSINARADFERAQRFDHVAYCELNIGIIAYYSGLFDLAIVLYQRAEAWFYALGIRGFILMCKRNQALALLRQGQYEAALALQEALEPAFVALGNERDLAELHHDRGMVLRDLGRIDSALAAFDLAERRFLELGIIPAAAENRIERGWLLLEQHNDYEAETCFTTAAHDLSDRPFHRWRALYGLGRIALQRGMYAQALAHYQQASALVALQRRRLTLAHASSAMFHQADALYRDACTLATLVGDPLALLGLAEQHRALSIVAQVQSGQAPSAPHVTAELETHTTKLRTQLEQPQADRGELNAALLAYQEALFRIPKRSQALAEQPFTLDVPTVRTLLNTTFPQGWTVLIYQRVDPAWWIITLTADTLDMVPVAPTAAEQALIQRGGAGNKRKHVLLGSLGPDPHEADWQTLSALGALLIPPPIRSRLHPAHRLLIVPADALHSLPWAALRVNDAWLIAQTTLQLLPSLSLWQHAQQQAIGTAALLVGIGDFQGRAKPLERARESLDVVERHWHGPVTRIENSAATRAALYAQTQHRYGLIHLATHGQLFGGHGLLAHLWLADGLLLADEIAQYQLYGARVVLAACEGARGEILPGEEQLNLIRAFLVAGASEVIGSLWQLYDNAILPLLTPLYTALGQGDDGATALAQAQRHMIALQTQGTELTDLLATPYVWAGLQVVSMARTTHAAKADM